MAFLAFLGHAVSILILFGRKYSKKFTLIKVFTVLTVRFIVH